MTTHETHETTRKEQKRIRPVIILPKDQVSLKDIARLNRNGLCVVEAQDPSLIRFMEPPPEGYSVQEKVAIKLCRLLLRRDRNYILNRKEFAELYADFLIEGTPLDSRCPEPVKKVKGQ